MSYLHSPKQNLFLAALPEKDYERLQSCLELVSLPQGWAVYENGGELGLVYFPTTGIISLLKIIDNEQPMKIAVIGNEGVFGISMLMGRKITPTRAVVQRAGFGYRLNVINLRREFELGSPLRYLLQQYTQNLLATIAKVTTPAIRPPLRSGIPFAGSPSPLA
jgi:hypothetical protein